MKKTFHLILLCILASFFFVVWAQKVKESNPNIYAHTYRYIAPVITPNDSINVYPQNAPYWTGTCTASSKTDNSEVRGKDTEDGWFVFDISGIPLGAIITSIIFYGYVNDTYYPAWSLTPMGTINPVTASASEVKTWIEAHSALGTAYVFANEYPYFSPGWHYYNLEAPADTDLVNAIPQGWFACGMDSRDNNISYYIEYDGWNESNAPYLIVDYSLPTLHDVGTASVDVPTYINPGSVIPKATVFNLSTASESFDVIMTVTPGSYTSTKTVTNLTPGGLQQVTFDSWNTSENDYTIMVCTQLSSDPNPANNCKSKFVRCNNFFGVSLYEQMANPGPVSFNSQNFEAEFDDYDNQGADDFIIPGTNEKWIISTVEVLGIYYSGTGPAASVNVLFYKDSLGHPGTLATGIMDVVPIVGLETGSFLISFYPFVHLVSGTYWLSVQCNMDFDPGGMWGWTEQLPFNLWSNWENPGGGFGTSCSTWGYRVTDCNVGSPPYYDLSFRMSGPLIPVELVSFKANASVGLIELSWITATETNNQGFEVQRSNGGKFQTLAFVEGYGTTTETKVYSYTDRDVNVGSFSYRLKQIDFDGTFEYSDIVEVDVPAPVAFALEQNYPNPFNPSTRIDFSLASDSKVTLKVYDLLGQQLATLLNIELTAGVHYVDFDGSTLNSGVYFYRLEATGVDGTNFVNIKKMILTK